MAVSPGGYGAAARFAPGSVESFKGAFFDREAVIKLMDKATHKALSKFGAYVRQRARTSLRYRDATSPPGHPPSAHKTMTRVKTNKKGVTSKQAASPLRDFTFFAYDRAAKVVYIGPAKTNQQNARGLNGQTVPEVIEYGGSETIFEHLLPNIPAIYGSRAGTWVRTDLRYRISQGGPRSAVNRPTRQRTAHYPARPWMGPAFDAELPKLVEFFRETGV
jgi:hypothetical protein